MFGNICHPERIHCHLERIHCHPERKRRISTTALAAILLTSCESIFDLNRLADEMEPYLLASGIDFVRNDPAANAAAAT